MPFPVGYDWTHQHHIGSKKGEWVDDESRALSGVFHEVYNDASKEAIEAGQHPPDLPTQIALLAEAVGGLKKGNVTRLGSFSQVVKAIKRGSQTVSRSDITQEMELMRTEWKKEMEAELVQQKKNMTEEFKREKRDQRHWLVPYLK